MRRILLILALWCSPVLAHAQGMTTLGAGSSPKAVVAAAYVGPGDVLTYTDYYGLRAYSSATRGTKLVNACNSTGGVDVGCGDLSSDASTGTIVPATISGITCPGANCTIKTYYDLAGGGLDLTQATVASRNTLTTSCVGITAGRACGTITGGRYTSVGAAAFALPVFFTAVASSASGGGPQDFFASNSIQTGLYITSANTVAITTNQTSNSLTTAMTQGAVHAVSGLGNAASSYIVVDGNAAVTGTLPSTVFSELLNIQGDSFGNQLVAGSTFQEGGYLNSNPLSATAQAVHANAKTYWGYP